MTLIQSLVGPPCRRGFSQTGQIIDVIDSASQMMECVGFGDWPLRREDVTVVAAQEKTLLKLIPSPEEQRELFEFLQRLHPADTRTFVENFLLVSPAPALQTV